MERDELNKLCKFLSLNKNSEDLIIEFYFFTIKKRIKTKINKAIKKVIQYLSFDLCELLKPLNIFDLNILKKVWISLEDKYWNEKYINTIFQYNCEINIIVVLISYPGNILEYRDLYQTEDIKEKVPELIEIYLQKSQELKSHNSLFYEGIKTTPYLLGYVMYGISLKLKEKEIGKIIKLEGKYIMTHVII